MKNFQYLLILSTILALNSCMDEKKEETPNNEIIETTTIKIMDKGLATKESSLGFQETIDTLTTRIESKGLRVFATINHHQNAEKNGFELAPTTLIIFGNPNVGAPLMQMNQSIGIDLPMKMLITEKEGKVTMTFNDPQYLKTRHDLPAESDKILAKVTGMLNELTDI